MVVEEIGEYTGYKDLLYSDIESILCKAINDDEDSIIMLIGIGVDSWWQSYDKID